MSVTPPPGWYPDCARPDRQRYWDGAGWTEHYYPPLLPSALSAGTNALGDQNGSEDSAVRRIRWRWVGAAVVAAAVPLAAGVAAMASHSVNATAAGQSSSLTATAGPSHGESSSPGPSAPAFVPYAGDVLAVLRQLGFECDETNAPVGLMIQCHKGGFDSAAGIWDELVNVQDWGADGDRGGDDTVFGYVDKGHVAALKASNVKLSFSRNEFGDMDVESD